MNLDNGQFAEVPATLKVARLQRLKNMVAALESAVQSRNGVNVLLDTVLIEKNLKNDAALSRLLGLSPPLISKLRHGVLPLGAPHILAIHEKAGMPVARIRELAA